MRQAVGVPSGAIGAQGDRSIRAWQTLFGDGLAHLSGARPQQKFRRLLFCLRALAVVRFELQRSAVDAVALAGRGPRSIGKDMTEVSIASAALRLDAMHEKRAIIMLVRRVL
jgi:hypothetical protein